MADNLDFQFKLKWVKSEKQNKKATARCSVSLGKKLFFLELS